MEHGALREERREEVAERQRAVVDVTAVIHLSDSLPNAPLGETQSCVTSNAANAQSSHTHTQRVYIHVRTHAEETHVYEA